MVNISPAELEAIMIPLPLLHEQRTLMSPVSAALKLRLSREAKAAQEIERASQEYMAAVGVTLASSTFPASYGVTLAQAKGVGVLGAQFFHPERSHAVTAALNASVGSPRRLGELAKFVNERAAVAPGQMLLGLSGVESNTGELVVVEEESKDGKRFAAGDVLFSRLRPYLNKVYCATADGVCSPEFHVLRPQAGVASEFLALALRSELVLAQTRHLSTGNTHPRLVEVDARRLVIPVPDENEQVRLGELISNRRVAAHSLRDAADRDWVQALVDLDAALLD